MGLIGKHNNRRKKEKKISIFKFKWYLITHPSTPHHPSVFFFLCLMHFLDSNDTFVDTSIDGCSNSEGTSDNSANTSKEANKRLGAGFAVYHLHWRDILRRITILVCDGIQYFFSHHWGLAYEKKTPGIPPLA